MGFTTLGNLISTAKVVRCGNGTYPVLSMTMHDGIMFQSDRFKKNLASIDQSNYKVVKRGQLVVGFPIDEGVLYIQKVADAGIMSPAYNVWNVNDNVVADYLERCLHSPQSMEYYASKLRGTTARRRSITTEDLLALPIPLPPIAQQRQIAATLDHVDRLISLRKQQLEKLDQLVKSRFVEMFEVYYGSGEQPLNKVCKFIDYRGKTPEKSENGIPLITAKNVRDNAFSIEPQEFIPAQNYESVMTRGIPKYNDILFTTEAPLGNVCRIPNLYDKFCVGQRIITMQPHDCITSEFLEYALLDERFRIKMWEKSSGSTVKGIRSKLLEWITIPLPPLPLQHQFATFVTATDKSKLSIQKSLTELETLKKSLMQQYFE